MSNILLAKPKLDSDWIDCGPGEPYVVREALENNFDLTDYSIDKNNWEYPSPNGLKKLVQFLEDKHKAPVVITNGAKGGLAAVFYALKNNGHPTVEMRNPYWALIPPLAKQHGIDSCFTENFSYKFPYLCLNPNNPDGYNLSSDELSVVHEKYKELNIPFIHDAAYYSHIYLPFDYELKPIGDVGIYSASKSYGLSGLRIGYCVCYDTSFYKPLVEYQEMMTVGVSSLSQEFFYNLLDQTHKHPFHFNDFTFEASKNLSEAKCHFKSINKDVLEIPNNFEFTDGMFAFLKVAAKANFAKSKINVVDGKHFGMPGYVRMNLAIGTDKIKKVIERLNRDID